MTIFYFTPYSVNKELGVAYNESCAIVPNDNDWICLMDGDTIFLSPTYGKHIADVIETHQDYDFFTCLTNRTGNKRQRLNGIIDEDSDLISLKRKVLERERDHYNQVVQLHQHISGHFMLFRKKLWNEFKFPTITKKGTILGIDNDWTQSLLDNGKKLGIIEGLVLIHYYRLTNGRSDKRHLL